MIIISAIPEGMVPSGTFWDEGGASFRAVIDKTQRGWHWHPINTKARAQGEPLGSLVPYYPIVGLPAAHRLP
jgi:hypothetical protein